MLLLLHRKQIIHVSELRCIIRSKCIKKMNIKLISLHINIEFQLINDDLIKATRRTKINTN
jgi:hypothetical protein